MILTLLKNLFKVGKMLYVVDSGDMRFGMVSFLGKTQKVLVFSPYGLMHHPPDNSMAIVMSQGSKESNGISIVDDPVNRTLKNLATGEVALGNYLTENYIYFDKNGLCTIKATDVNIISDTLKHNGVNIGDDHEHDGVTTGSSNTGGPQ